MSAGYKGKGIPTHLLVDGLGQPLLAMKLSPCRKNINGTKIAVQKMKELSANVVLKTVAIVAVSCFATWVVQGLIQSGAINISFVSQRGGGTARVV